MTRNNKNLSICKYETLGNCYLILDPAVNGYPEGFVPGESFIQRVCDMHYGVGSNGIIVGPERHETCAFGFRIYNSDASRAQFSGNGSRIFGKYIADMPYGTDTKFVVSALSDLGKYIDVEVECGDGQVLTSTTFKVAPSFGIEAVLGNGRYIEGLGDGFRVHPIAAIGKIAFGTDAAWGSSTLLSIGNQHCVTFVDDVGHLPSFDMLHGLRSLRDMADRPTASTVDPLFSSGCNLQWARVRDSRNIDVRIVERGEGPTLASGSSATAVSIAAYHRGLIDPQVVLHMLGGDLEIRLTLDAHGNAREVTAAADVNWIADIAVASPDKP